MGRRKEEVVQGSPDKTICRGTCRRELTLNSSNFFKSNADEYRMFKGFCTICKPCMEKLLLDEKGYSTPERFKSVLKYLDVVYIPKIYQQALEKCDDTNQKRVLGDYRSLISLNSTYKNCRFVDSVRFEYQELEEEENSYVKVPKALIDFWGTDVKEPRLYEVYQNEYDRLCYQDGGEINSIKEGYFKTIAILMSTGQQQLLQGNLKEHETTMKTLTTICEKCGINPKQVQDKDDSNRGTFGVFIKMVENEEPIFDIEKDLGKIDVVKRCLEVFFFGHLAEVNGFRNPLKCQYDEVMKQYSVSTETYEDLMAIEETEEEEVKGFRKLLKFRRDKFNGIPKKVVD